MSVRSLPFSPRLPPLPDSPAASIASSRSTTASSPFSASSHTHYHSPLASPRHSRVSSSSGSVAIRLDTTTDEELEDESSSDVEIYLSSLGLADSSAISLSSNSSLLHSSHLRIIPQQPSINFSQQHVSAAIDDSPILPTIQQQPDLQYSLLHSHSPSYSQLQAQAQAQTQAHEHEHEQSTTLASPPLPSAPAQPTIPLPPISSTGPTYKIFEPRAHTQAQPIFEHPLYNQSQNPSHPGFNPAKSLFSDSNDTLDLGIDLAPGVGPEDQAGKTPNVYINGLPPHFPEDQLFALAAPFGPVRSVRTFTRHVRDSESGYGFVLFETIEAAEKCILSLRRYRNLHPTFSKQAHKIPGTTTSAPPLSLGLPLNIGLSAGGTIQLDTPPGSLKGGWQSGSEYGTANGVGDSEYGTSGLVDDSDYGSVLGSGRAMEVGLGVEGGSASFKAKMESLHDRTSTNLYMEGLPLSIDEPTLTALVSPHRISSSRFFQTRLSNPPRIIAFVRFETRAGAEEIIERLHGRMVRGWNDAGSRISVRFADTAEQRELRRQERLVREGDESPARLTIAQASLLNLHGQDLGIHSSSSTNSLPPAPPIQLRIPTPQFGDYSNDYRHHNGHLAHNHSPHAHTHTHTPPFQVDYSLAPGARHNHNHNPYATTNSRAHTPPVHLHPGHGQNVYDTQSQSQPPMDPAMAALLEGLRNGSGGNAGGSTYGTYQDNHGHFSSNRHLAGNGNGTDYGGEGLGLVTPGGHHHQFGHRPHSRQHQHSHQQHQGHFDRDQQARSSVRERGGYTATEEYIMRAHAEGSAQQQQQILQAQQQQLQLQQAQLQLQLQQAQMAQQAQSQGQLPQQRITRRPVPPPLDLQPERRRRDSDANVVGVPGQGAGFGMGMRAFRAPAAPQVFASPLLGEDEFHSHSEQGVGGGGAVKHTHNHRIHPAHVNARLGALEHQQQQQGQGSPSLMQGNYQQAHLRSSTLPHRASPAVTVGRHYQHSSMSVAGSTGDRNGGGGGMNNNNTFSTIGNINNNNSNSNDYDGDTGSAGASPAFSTNSNNNTNTNNFGLHLHGSNNNNGVGLGGLFDKVSSGGGQGQGQGQGQARYHHPNSKHNHTRNHSVSQTHSHHHSQSKSHQGSHIQPHAHVSHLTASSSDSQLYDSNIGNTGTGAESSPELISPALTYASSQQSHTPSTLSPATPFFSTMETGVGLGQVQGQGQQEKGVGGFGQETGGVKNLASAGNR